ncbi:MAG: winged helix-turn-helix domain-containing protein [Candidatus Methanofastidiosia archaeon]|jgi:DNA-binding transcriptional ArsR family regulator
MCDGHCGRDSLQEFAAFQKYVRALHCPTRWVIIKLIGKNALSTNQIFEGLSEKGESLSRSGLYYHLSELENAGIIELAEYRETGGGAPEKVWKLKTKKIEIDLTGI